MQFRFFIILLKNLDDAVEELNRFLRGNRVLAVQKEFVSE